MPERNVTANHIRRAGVDPGLTSLGLEPSESTHGVKGPREQPSC